MFLHLPSISLLHTYIQIRHTDGETLRGESLREALHAFLDAGPGYGAARLQVIRSAQFGQAEPLLQCRQIERGGQVHLVCKDEDALDPVHL